MSEESKSNVELKAKVIIRAVSKCVYMLRLESADLIGETIQDKSILTDLMSNAVQFRINSDGELDPNLDFVAGDKPWSRNIKRGILSAFQIKSIRDLRSLPGEEKKSGVIYETDVLGRCRTTYSTKDEPNSAEINLKKKKSLQRCTLTENVKTSAIQYQPYKNMPVRRLKAFKYTNLVCRYVWVRFDFKMFILKCFKRSLTKANCLSRATNVRLRLRMA